MSCFTLKNDKCENFDMEKKIQHLVILVLCKGERHGIKLNNTLTIRLQLLAE